MANSYTRADVVAAWQFEASPGIWKDTKAIQPDLSPTGPPTADTTNQMEGAQCASFAAGQYLSIADAALAAGFPLKSSDTTKIITVSCWVRPTTVDANKRRIWSKYKATGNQRSLQLYHNSSQIYLQYSLAGNTGVELSLGFGAMVANQKYYITVSVDGIGINGTPIYWARIFNATAGTWYFKAGTFSAGSLFAGTADWRIGADDDNAANTTFIGQIDEVLVFNSRLHNSEVVAIKGGNFPVAGDYIYDFLHDPGVAADTYNGFSSWASAFKTLKHPFYFGDIIYCAKSLETNQAGTATATTGDRAVATTNDLSTPCAQYTIIRFDSDPTIYMVRSVTSSVINLYRPYRGVTGAGKIVKVLTRQVVGNSDITPTAFTGTLALPIIYKGGVNTSTFAQDGFSVHDGQAGTNVSWGNASLAAWIISNFGVYNFNWSILNSPTSDCVLNNFFNFRQTIIGIITHYRLTINGVVAEQSDFPAMNLYNSVINDPETANDVVSYYGWHGCTNLDTIINRWRNAGYAGTGKFALILSAFNWGLRFVDPILDELGLGGNLIAVAQGSTGTFCEDVVFHNPTLGTGILLSSTGSWIFMGEINLVNIGGNATDHRSFFGLGINVAYIQVTPDYSVYNTSAPSVKITLPGGASSGPFYQRHYVPCEAGVARTISARLRKNASYGSAGGANIAPIWSLPFMRLRWMTGTPPNLVHNVHDVPMADVNDAFQLVSYTITPSIKGMAIVELYFNSPNAGSIGWYDDVPS